MYNSVVLKGGINEHRYIICTFKLVESILFELDSCSVFVKCVSSVRLLGNIWPDWSLIIIFAYI